MRSCTIKAQAFRSKNCYGPFEFCTGLLIVHFSNVSKNSLKVQLRQFLLIKASSFFMTSSLSKVNLAAASISFSFLRVCKDSTLNNSFS